MPRVLCVDEDVAEAESLALLVRELGHEVETVCGDGALGRLPVGRRYDLVVVAISGAAPPAADGVAPLLECVRARVGDTPLLVTAPFSDAGRGRAAIEAGALDCLTRPLRRETVRLAVKHALDVGRLRRENEDIRRQLASRAPRREVVGQSPAMKALLDQVDAVAPTRAGVLLIGESGTGKELVARAIHERSPRRERPMVSLNCAALPEGLVESLLFGHERGAFTGAAARTVGAFERAHEGTLLLDEISEMRLDLQAKLLRALQEQEFERVGGSTPVRVDVRLVATTNRDLAAEVEAGRFRRDLYYRLSVVPLHVPPLRERLEDVPLLAGVFVNRAAAALGVPAPRLTPEIVRALVQQPWPGNVRELENTMERAVILSRGGPLRLDLREPPAVAPPRPRVHNGLDDLPLNLREVERRMIDRALKATGGHRGAAARLLGISDRTLRNKLREQAPD